MICSAHKVVIRGKTTEILLLTLAIDAQRDRTKRPRRRALGNRAGSTTEPNLAAGVAMSTKLLNY